MPEPSLHSNTVIEVIERDIEDFQKSPLIYIDYFTSYILTSVELQRFCNFDDILESFIAKSTTSRLAFTALKKLSASLILKNEPLPSQLEIWLVNELQGNIVEPSSGKVGPNKTEVEHLLLISCVRKAATLSGLPIYPRSTTGVENCAIGLVASASKNLKQKSKKTPFPTKPLTVERRYLAATKWLKKIS